VAVFFAEVVDSSSGGFEDPQPEQSQHHHQREVAVVGGLPGGGEQRLELQVGQPNVGESTGTVGRRTCAAGECASTPSITQVR